VTCRRVVPDLSPTINRTGAAGVGYRDTGGLCDGRLISLIPGPPVSSTYYRPSHLMSKADNATTVRLQLPDDQLDWLQSIAERRDMSLDAVVSSLVGVCRNAATASVRRRTQENASSSSQRGETGGGNPDRSAGAGTSASSSDGDSALDRLRKARSEVESVRASESSDTSSRASGEPNEKASDTSEENRPPASAETDEDSFFDMVTSGARNLTDKPDEDSA